MPDYRIGAYNIREYNVGILKQYADDYYKLVNLRSVRKAGMRIVRRHLSFLRLAALQTIKN